MLTFKGRSIAVPQRARLQQGHKCLQCYNDTIATKSKLEGCILYVGRWDPGNTQALGLRIQVKLN